jgi:type I restriction enzyme S subunit
MKPGWKIVKFGDVVKNANLTERNPAAAGIDRIVGLEHLDPENLHIRRWNAAQDGTSFSRKFVPGQTLFGKRRAYQRKVAFAEFEGICSGDILTFEPKSEKVLLPELLPFICQSDAFFDHALGTSAGSLSPRTSWKALKDFEFPLPSIEEQKRIAEILWAADEVVESNLNLLKSINIYKETLIERELVSTSKEGNLEDYCLSDGIKIGPFGSLLHLEDYQSEGVPVVMPADIENGAIVEERIARISHQKADELANYRLRENDILFPRRGDLTKRAIVLKNQENWLCGTGTIRVRLKDNINPRAVFLAVTSDTTNRWLERFSVGTTMPNLNASTIKKIPFHLPEGLAAAKILENLENIMDAFLHSKSHFNNLEKTRKHLLEHMINGRI